MRWDVLGAKLWVRPKRKSTNQIKPMADDILRLDHADFAMRNWHGDEPGRPPLGSAAHKRLFCRMLLETHNPYKPAVIAWPKLAPEALHRITSLPI